MERITVYPDTPHLRTLTSAIDALERGELVIYPTDTVYGIGCSIYKKRAIEQLYQIKGKSKFEHMSILCGSIHQAAEFVQISNTAYRILKRCFPGPYTIILPAKNCFSKLMLTRQKEVGVRISGLAICQLMVEELGFPILNTSVIYGKYETADEAYSEFDVSNEYTNAAGIMLDAGPLENAGVSTVFQINAMNEIEILREGKGEIDILYR